MTFTVTLYEHEKRENSTKRPTGTGKTTDCVLRRGSSAIRPVLEFDFGTGNTGNPLQYNYVHISSFNRYYFIQDWSWIDGLWIASCECDVLATYKTQIGSTSLYILRASAASDGNITDTMYPAKTGCSFSHASVTTPWTLTNGVFVLGVINNNPTIGGVDYVCLNESNMNSFMSALCDNSIINVANGFNLSDASEALQRSIMDPIQYVKSAIYIPLPFTSMPGTSFSSLGIYGYTLPAIVAGLHFGANASRYHTSHVFDIPKHPQAATRGAYLNQAPYSLYTMTIPPFGQVELDTTIMRNATQIGAAVDVDLVTGLGILTISCNGCIISRLEAQVGVPVQLSQVTRDYVGAITAAVSGAASIVTGAVVGGPVGAANAISGGVGAIGDAVRALAPRQQTVGSGGSYSQLIYDWRLDAQFFSVVDEDNAHNGRPYCRLATPSSLSGYMLIRDGDVATDGTLEEDAKLKQFLETGFYYE